MSEGDTGRDLTTTRSQVFGDVEKGVECRVCGRNVDDGRSKTCSDYCNNLLSAVMGMLNWSSVRRRITERDNETCQHCGWSLRRERCAREHIRERIEELAGECPESPGVSERDEWDEFDWDDYHERAETWRECRERMQARYGDPYNRACDLEVDHIERVADGGHPFDPANLQTLCEECHRDKTARENSKRGRPPSRGDLSRSLFEFVTDGGESPAHSSTETEHCENCGTDGETADRTAEVTNPHSGEARAETVALCKTCADAFDMGAGNL